MALLSAAIAFVGILCFFDLLLSFAIIRRLRDRPPDPRYLPAGLGHGRLAAGTPVPPFTAVTSAGLALTLDDLRGRPSAFGFFAADCPSCRDHLGEFAEFTRSFPSGRSQVLAVMAGNAGRGADLLAALDDIATVVVEPDQGPIQRAFAVDAFPSFFTLDTDARISGGSMNIAGLRVSEQV